MEADFRKTLFFFIAVELGNFENFCVEDGKQNKM
jgi:hypothetical protein